MAWPGDNNPIVGEFFINNAWVNVSSSIRGADKINITRGKRDVQGVMPATLCDFTLNNADGDFTDDNPLSPYFELLPLYMPCRFTMPGATDSYLYTTGYDEDAAYVSTADKAALDIVGDIDIRAEISPAGWNFPGTSTGATRTALIASKSASTQISWFFGLRSDGVLVFQWSTTGSNGIAAGSNSLTTATDRMAVRVTLDVNDGAGNKVITFYTSDSIDGTWTVNRTITSAGTTSIFSSTAPLEICSAGGGTGGNFTNVVTWSGKIYCVKVLSSIGGSVVANADFRSRSVGDTSWSDGLGNTWAVNGDAYVTSDSVRFWGEVENLPQEWDETGNDVFARVHAGDILQRLNTSGTPLRSPIYANRIQVDPTGYWTFEDGVDATRASAASRNTPSATTTNVRFKADDTLNGSDGCIQFDGAGAVIRGKTRVDVATGTTSFLFFFKFGTIPVTTVPMIFVGSAGSVAASWRIECDGASFTVRAFNVDGTLLLNSPILIGGVTLTEWISMRLELTTSGGNIAWALAWNEVAQDSILGTSGTIAGAPGRFVGYTIVGHASNTDMYLAHIVIDNATTDFSSADFVGAANGYIGESYASRFRRLCIANGITPDLDGWEFESALCGRQRVDTLLNVLNDGPNVDGGILLGSRRQGNALTYITRQRIQTAPYVVQLSHETDSHLAKTPKPIKDSTGVKNDVTVTRPGGGSSRRVVTDGRYGTDAIGTIPDAQEVNVYIDDDTEPVAGWLASLGTWNEARIPDIAVALNRTETLFGSTIAKQILATDVGRWISLINMPVHQKPGPIEQIAQGYSEAIDNKTWTISFNGTPYGPWRAGIIQGLLAPARFAATNTTVNAATSTATSLTFVTAAGSRRWVVAADVATTPFPFDALIAGERVTINGITGTTNTQTVDVTRSVNGIIKAITGNPQAQLFYVTTFGR